MPSHLAAFLTTIVSCTCYKVHYLAAMESEINLVFCLCISIIIEFESNDNEYFKWHNKKILDNLENNTFREKIEAYSFLVRIFIQLLFIMCILVIKKQFDLVIIF